MMTIQPDSLVQITYNCTGFVALMPTIKSSICQWAFDTLKRIDHRLSKAAPAGFASACMKSLASLLENMHRGSFPAT